MHGVVENPISDLLSGGVFHPHPLFIPYTRSLSACKNMSEIKSERIVKLPSFFLLYFVTAFKKDKLKNLGGKFLSICFWKKKSTRTSGRNTIYYKGRKGYIQNK